MIDPRTHHRRVLVRQILLVSAAAVVIAPGVSRVEAGASPSASRSR